MCDAIKCLLYRCLHWVTIKMYLISTAFIWLCSLLLTGLCLIVHLIDFSQVCDSQGNPCSAKHSIQQHWLVLFFSTLFFYPFQCLDIDFQTFFFLFTGERHISVNHLTVWRHIIRLPVKVSTQSTDLVMVFFIHFNLLTTHTNMKPPPPLKMLDNIHNEIQMFLSIRNNVQKNPKTSNFDNCLLLS